MKKFCLILAVCLLAGYAALPFGGTGVVLAEESSAPAASDFDFEAELRAFVEANPSRQAGSEGERSAASYLRRIFSDAGLTPFEPFFLGRENGGYDQTIEVLSGSTLILSQNVIGVQPAAGESLGTLVIGAHYDNAADYVAQLEQEGNYGTVVSGERTFQGAYDNGSGVTVLLSLVSRFSGLQLPFDLVFCLFGAEEPGLYGSETFVTSLTEQQRADILLYVNLDSIAAGDYLYLYTDEVSTLHDGYLREAAAENGITLTPNPVNKKISSSGLKYFPYLHVGLSSDHLSFMQYRINVANFFTLNWSSPATYTDESLTRPDIMHTPNDDVDILLTLYPDTAVQYMQNVSDLVYTAASADPQGFAAAMRQSFEQKPNYDFWLMQWPALLIGVVLILAAGLVLFLLWRAWSSYKVPPAGAPVGQESVFGDEFE